MLAEGEEEWPDRIAECFAGKTILISGVSGFLGKVLVEKLLRCCTDLRRVYVILRPKYNRTIAERLEHMYQSPLFDELKVRKGNAPFAKVRPICGDIAAPNLGLSPASERLLVEEVQIVIHAAANCRFDESLKTAVLTNVRGTKLMLDLAKRMPRLLIFLHVSTAYCHLHERVIREVPYPPPDDPNMILSIIEGLNDEDLSVFLHKILDDVPNTYTYTKALAEGLINTEIAKMPIVLLRPSFVIPIWKDPLPGWTDTINGIVGFIIASGKGILRTMHTDEDHYTDFLPADVAASAFLFTVFEYLTFQVAVPLGHRQNVHNITTSAEHCVTWKKIKRIGREVMDERVPLNGVVWYPDTLMTTNFWLYSVLAFFFHLLPALLLDPILIALGYGPILLKAHRRLLKGFDMIAYYSRNQWEFRSEWALSTRAIMNPRERQTYVLSGEGINYADYFELCVLSARRHILHEADDTIAAAKRRLKIMYYVDIAAKFILGYFIITTITGYVLSYALPRG